MHDWQAYLPAYVTSYLVAHRDQSPVGFEQRFHAVAMFADIAGFTPLSESLAATGTAGAEQLTNLLNQCFAPLIDVIQQHGGIINSFGGDAITALFPLIDEPLLFVVQRAVQCALEMQTIVGQQGTLSTAAGDWNLTLRIGLAAGEVLQVTAGDPDQRLLSVVTGAPLLHCGQAENHAQAGEIIVHVPSFSVTFLELDPLPNRTFARVRAIQYRVPHAPVPAFDHLDQATRNLMAAYLHSSIAQRLRDKQTTFINERRTVTMLFVQFRNLDDSSDASLAKRLVLYFNAVLRTVQRYGGYINKVEVGDKGSTYLVLFGAPVAHENDADRAAHCALELHALEHAEVRIGMNTGFVFCGLIGSNTRQEYTVIGDVVNVAARLMLIADHGQILMTNATHAALGPSFLTAPLPAITIKGKTEPLDRFELTDLRQTGARIQEPTYVLPMVGRTIELGLISEKLALAKQRKGQIISITGDAGMGKSRLGAEIRRIARANRCAVYSGECLSYGTNISYLLWHNVWRAFFNVDPGWLLDLQLLQLRAQLAVINPSWLDWIPLMANALRLPISDEALSKLLDVRSRKMLLESLLGDCVRYRANESPLVFMLEDCHWIDPLSLDLLNHIATLIADVPVMIVLLHRPSSSSQESQWLSEIRALPYWTNFTLNEFAFEETAELVRLKLRHMLGGNVALNENLIKQIAQRAQGNPFYIEELLNLMIDRGFDPNDQQQLEALDLPDSLHRLIISRIDQLDEGVKTTLKVASVIGRLFKAHWLWGAYPELGTNDEVIANLETLRRMDLTPLDRTDPDLEYLFKHVITQEVAYQSLPFATRASLHEKIASYIENTYPASGSVDLLAHHYGFSTNQTKQREYFRKAADAAAARYANETAMAYYQRLVPLLETTESIPVLFELGGIQKFMGRWADAEQTYQAAFRNASVVNNIVGMGRALSEIGDVLSSQGQHEQAMQYSDDGLLLAHQSQNIDLEIRVLLRKGWILYACGRLEHALEVAQEVVNLALTWNDPMLLALSYKLHGYVLVHLGQPDAAIKSFEQALEIHQRNNDYEDIGRIYNVMGEAARARGDFRSAVEWYKEALIIGRELRNPERLIMYLSNLGGALVGVGEYAQAIAHLKHSLDLSRTTSWYAISETYRFLAEAYAGHGDYEAAVDAICQSLESARKTQQVLDMGNALRILGTLWDYHSAEQRATHSLPNSADECFKQSHAIHHESHAVAEEARTLRAWGVYALTHQQRDTGLEYLKQAQTLFESLGLESEVIATTNDMQSFLDERA